jgi:hypothetical protein
MAHEALRVRSAPPGVVLATPGVGVRSRQIAVASGVAELAFGLGLLGCATSADGARRGLVVAITVAFLVVRVVLGWVRAGLLGGVALGLLTATGLVTVAATLGESADLRLAAALVALGMVPWAAGSVPAMTLPLERGERRDVTPCLLTSALCGGLGVLAAIVIAGAVDVDDDRLSTLVPYIAVAFAMLAMAEVLGHHRIGSGFPGTVVVIAAGALALHLVLLADQRTSAVEAAVSAATIASAAAALGLLASTALASPRPLVVPVEEAAGGPRLVLVTIIGLAAAAVGVRLISLRPFWLDEADTARVTDASFADMERAARSGHAHPPLMDVLVWASRQAFGSNDLALRLPSLAAGVLLVPLAYVTAEKLFDRRVGVIAAAIVAAGPGFIWVSGTAQPAALAALLATASLLTFTLALERERFVDWVLFGAAAALLLWTHQLGFVTVAVLHAAAGLAVWRADDAPRPARLSRWATALAIDIAAFVALLVYRDGLGPPGILPPFEYATRGAPGAGRSVFGLAGMALSSLVGFHPADVTSRLLAMWPLCMLAMFLLLGRSWTSRGALVAALALTPFITLLVLQIAGAPRNPPFALEWTATAMPMLAIGVAYVVGRAGAWRTARIVGLAVVAVLLVAAVDQRARVEPLDRYDIEPAVDEVARQAQPGDVVVYAPADIGDLVAHEVQDAEVIGVDEAADRDTTGTRVVLVGAFAMRAGDPSLDRLLDVVEQIAAERTLIHEAGNDEVKVWTFE